jgi:hypothetical protein
MVAVSMFPVSGVPLLSWFWKVIDALSMEHRSGESFHVRLQVLVQIARLGDFSTQI